VKAQSFRFAGKFTTVRTSLLPLILSVFVLALGYTPSLLASAANLYISPSGGGSGSSCADALGVSWFNASGNWGSGSNQIGAGTTIHLCAGTYSFPAGTVTGLLFQGSGSSASPITLQADGVVVITAPYWPSNGSAMSTNGKNFILINGQNQLTLQASANGTLLANQVDGGNGILAKGGNNVTIENLAVSNIYVHACTLPVSNCTDEIGHSTGDISGYGSNFLVQGCTVHDAKDGVGLNYPGGVTYANMTVQNNVIYNIDHGIEVGDGGPNSTVTNIVLKSNEIHDFQNWDDAANNNHHDGIHQFAYNSGDVVSGYFVNGNYIHGDFGHNMNAAIFQESTTETTASYYFNNIIADESSVSHLGCGEICLENVGAVIVNNTITSPTGQGTTGINVYNANNLIQNNIITSMSEAIATEGLTSSTTIDYNNYFNIGGSGWNQGNFSGWQSSSCAGGKCDAHGSNINPNLDGTYRPQTSSASIVHHGCNLTTVMGVSALDIDRAGIERPHGAGCQTQGTPSAWDIGAYNYGSSVATVQPPTGLAAIVE
jgi:Right handed beta helix region